MFAIEIAIQFCFLILALILPCGFASLIKWIRKESLFILWKNWYKVEVLWSSKVWFKFPPEPSWPGIFFLARFLPLISLMSIGMVRDTKECSKPYLSRNVYILCKSSIYCHKIHIFMYLIDIESMVMSLFSFLFNFICAFWLLSLINLLQIYKELNFEPTDSLHYNLISIAIIYSSMFTISFHLGDLFSIPWADLRWILCLFLLNSLLFSFLI